MSPTIARKVVEHFSPKKSKTHSLTPRQMQIAEGIIEGLSYKLIADKLLIKTETVRDHIKSIYRKLEINSKTQLIKKEWTAKFREYRISIKERFAKDLRSLTMLVLFALSTYISSRHSMRSIV